MSAYPATAAQHGMVGDLRAVEGGPVGDGLVHRYDPGAGPDGPGGSDGGRPDRAAGRAAGGGTDG